MTNKTLRSTSGAPWINNEDSKTAGPKGPILLEDYQLLEKLAHQNREQIPQRTVHAKGSGAHGTFTVTKDITAYTKAAVFSEVGKKTDLFVRFSIALAQKGSPETARDIRGMAIKYYTEEGNWDLICNNTPVFFVRDPNKFPDFIHAFKAHPKTNMPSMKAAWDFLSLSPESIHETLRLFSDNGLPSDYRHMDTFGCHTYSMYNKEGKRYWVKFHFKTQQGVKFLTTEEAAKIAAQNVQSYHADLYQSIEKGDFPKWTLYLQIMTDEQIKNTDFNPFDVTKIWPEKDYPLHEVGVLELNRNPDNYFAEVEQATFSPANFVPGISASPDRLLQGRLFTYQDAHFYRVGTNYEMLPINRPRVEVHNYHLDGAMRFDAPKFGDGDYYEPNSFGGPIVKEDNTPPPYALQGDAAFYPHDDEQGDDFRQARDLFATYDSDQKQRLYQNIAGAMKGIPQDIIDRQLQLFEKTDPEWANGVKNLLNAS